MKINPILLLIVLQISLLFLDTCQNFGSSKRFPNIKYMSNGYDIFIGNPRSGNSDPGWRQSVFKFSYKEGENFLDDIYEVPNTIDVCNLHIIAGN